MATQNLKLLALAFTALAAPFALAQTATEVVVYGPAPKPVPVPGVKPIAAPSFDALKGDGSTTSRAPASRTCGLRRLRETEIAMR